MSESTLALHVYTPSGSIFDEQGITAIRVHLEDRGLIGIHPGHIPLIAMADRDTLYYEKNGDPHQLQVQPGILIVSRNIVRILTTG